MIRTWSFEEVVVRVCSAAAVGVQAVLDFGGRLERATRPLGHDHDRVVDGGEWLAEAEEQQEVWEGCACCQPDPDHHAHGCLLPVDHHGVCCTPDAPDPYEPGLSADELVGVRGILQERYGAMESGQDCGLGQASETCAARLQGCLCIGQHTNGWHTCVHGAKWPVKNFAGAAASLADGARPVRVSSSHPSVREDKQQDVSDCGLGLACVSPADPHTDPPAADHRPAGATGDPGVCDIPPSPSGSPLDPSRGNRLASVRGEGPGSDSGIPQPPEPGHPNLEFPDPAEMHLWPDWLLMMHAANCLSWPTNADLTDELRKRSHVAENLAAQEK